MAIVTTEAAASSLIIYNIICILLIFPNRFRKARKDVSPVTLPPLTDAHTNNIIVLCKVVKKFESKLFDHTF